MKRILALVLAALTLCLALTGCGGGELDVQKARTGVVRVALMAKIQKYALTEDNELELVGTIDEPVLFSTGSGFAVGGSGTDPDTFVTNRHVVEDGGNAGVVMQMDDGSVEFWVPVRTGIYLLLDDHSYDSANGLDKSRAVLCDVIYQADEDSPDIAVLKATEPVSQRTALPIYDGEVKQGDRVWALGFPGTSDDAMALDLLRGIQKRPSGLDSITVTDGIVSKVGWIEMMETIKVNANCIQSTAQINHGNSGGPLMNGSGAVVGLNTYGYEELAYAISAQELMNVLDNKGIEYEKTSGGLSLPIVPIIIGIVVLGAVIAVVVLAASRKKPVPPTPPPVPDDDKKQFINKTVDNNSENNIPPPPPPPPPVVVGGPRIQGEAGHFMGRRFSIDGTVRLGRDPGKNDLVYPSGTQGVSGVHCQVARQGERLFLTDLGSTYGTFLSGGKRLAAHETVELRIGDKFWLGSEQQMFRVAGKGGV